MDDVRTFGELALLFSSVQKKSLKDSSFCLLNFNLTKYILPCFCSIPLELISAVNKFIVSMRVFYHIYPQFSAKGQYYLTKYGFRDLKFQSLRDTYVCEQQNLLLNSGEVFMGLVSAGIQMKEGNF